jgi:hypothetical protein
VLLKCAQITIELHLDLNLLLQQLLSDIHCILFTFHGSVLKPTACSTLVRKVADDIRIQLFFIYFGIKKINMLVVFRAELTGNFIGLVTSGIGPAVARGPHVGPRWFIPLNIEVYYSFLA